MSVKRMNNRRWRGLVPAGIMLAVLSGCGATAMIPSTWSATAETAAKGAGSQMETMDPEKLLQEDVWPVLSVLEGTAETAVWLPFEARLEVENIDQNPELPNGCEITSAAIVLNYLGFEVDKVTLAEKYLPRCVPYWEADPRVEFMGNPEDELAFYCLPGAVVTAVNDYLEDVDAGYTAVDISGSAVEELYQWVAGGYPVMVWTTRAFSEPLYNDTFLLPDGDRPYSNSHCLVLTGYDDDTCYLADPMLEVETVERERFAESYLERGQYAVVIVPTELAE